MSSSIHTIISADQKNKNKEFETTSRIKFKTVTSDSRNHSRSTTPSKRSFNERTPSTLRSYNPEVSDPLDSASCYHIQCNLPYSAKGNIRKPSLLVECLPKATFQRLAAVWGIDPGTRAHGNTCKLDNKEKEELMVEEYIKNVERDIGIRSDISDDLQVNIGSDVGTDKETQQTRVVQENPYVGFFKKDHEHVGVVNKKKSNLGKKAGKITKSIIKKFLAWYQSLGGNDGETFIEESTLLELFQIGFDMPAAKSLCIQIRELPTVPECLALLQNEPKHAIGYGLKQFLKQDIKMENIPIRMFAFGSMLPKENPPLRYKPPKNFTKKTWMECSRVPIDLKSMKTVWSGLEKLRSTIAFSNWLKNHPEITPPDYLTQKGLLQINYDEWIQMYKGFEVEVDNVEVTEHDSRVSKEEPSAVQKSKIVESLLKFDSFESIL